MTLQEYFGALRERWVSVLVGFGLAFGVALGAWSLSPPQYTARETLYISAQLAEGTLAAYQGAQLSEQRVRSYVELVDSDRIRSEVEGAVGFDISDTSIEGEAKPDSVLIEISATGPSPERSAAIARETGTAVSNLVSELERSTLPGSQPQVSARVVQSATIPEARSSSGLPVALAAATLLGLLAGVSSALIRQRLDTSVKTLSILQATTNATNLGFVTSDSDSDTPNIIADDTPSSPRSELYRQIRTNLQYSNVDGRTQSILVTSSLPGEGKSTTTVNLGLSVCATGQKVLLIEADMRRPKLSAMMGLERSVGLSTTLAGRIPIAGAIQTWRGMLDVLSSGPIPPNPSELLASKQMRTLLDQLRMRYELIIIDSPPLLPVTDAAALAPAVDGVLVVCKYRTTKTPQLRSAIVALESVSARIVGTVLTHVPTSGRDAYGKYSSYYQSETQATDPNFFHRN